MKCTNCGFDAENNTVCPICGHQISPVQNQEPPVNPQNIPPQPQPAQQNPYTAPTAPQNPYTAPPQQYQAPAGGYNNQNQPAPQYNPAPNIPPLPAATPKKGVRPGIIVLICIVATVIAAGIVIAIISQFTPKSVFDVFNSQTPYYNDVYDYQYETADPATIDISGINAHKIGDSFEVYGCGTATVTKLEKQTSNKPVNPDFNRYAMTIEFKNSRPTEGSFPDLCPCFYDGLGRELTYLPEPELEYLYTDYGGEQYQPIESGKTATQVVYFDVKNTVNKLYVRFENYTVTNPENSSVYYELELK